MPAPTKPNVYPIWTQGNNPARQQPTNGAQFAGFAPNFRPPAGWHNWLFGIFSDWIAWLDFVTTGGVMPVSNVGHVILTGTTLQAQLDECDAFLSSLGVEELVGRVTANPAIYTLNKQTLNGSNPLISLGAGFLDANEFIYSAPGGNPQVQFNVAPAPGQVPQFFALTAINPGAGGSSITGGFVAIGVANAPVVVPAAAGVLQYNNQRTLVFTVSSGGVTPITAAPQVAAGTKVGQELRLVGTSDANAIQLADGNGLSLNGPITLGNNVSLDLYWNGLVWAESDRSN